jgi:hypothetical protein
VIQSPQKPGSGFRDSVSHLVRFNACCVLSVPRVFAACCGTGRMLHLLYGVCAVLSTGRRVQCFAHAAGCPLPTARRTRNAAVPCDSCGISHVLASSSMSSAVYCTLSVACVAWSCRLLRGICCMLHVALLPVACCQWSCSKFHVVCCMLHVARCMLHVALHVVLVRCMLLEVLRMLPVAWCMPFAVRCILPAA